MANVAELDLRTLVTEWLDAQDLWRVAWSNDRVHLSGAAMRAFCKWLVNTGRATEGDVRELRQQVVRVYEQTPRGR